MARPVRPSEAMKRYVKSAGSPSALRPGGSAASAPPPAPPPALPVAPVRPRPPAIVSPPPAPAAQAPLTPRSAYHAWSRANPVPPAAPRPISPWWVLVALLLAVLAVLLQPLVAHGHGLPERSSASVRFDLDAGLAPRAPEAPAVHVRPHRREPASEGRWLLAFAILVGVVAGRRSARRAANAPPSDLSQEAAETAPAPAVRRTLGAHSAAGNTRESNQDRVQTAHVDGLDVIVVGDGLGGLPHGEEAAETATTFALAHLARELPGARAASFEGVRTLLLSTVWAAASALAREATARGWTAFDDGFRTTLIVVVVLPECYVAAWVGDGGIFVVRHDGEVVSVLEPHKDAATPDLLDASLGPASDGRPSWAVASRKAGDVLLAATDGVADVFDAASVPLLRDHLARAEGDAQLAAESLVDAHAAQRDASGHALTTDNLTIAIVTTGDSV